VLLGVVLLAAVAFWFFGRGGLAWCARRMAARQIEMGAVTSAQQWLARSAWLDPDDGGKTALMRAACFRHPYQEEQWSEALQRAKQQGAPAEPVEQEVQLGILRSGRFPAGAEQQMGALIERGLSPRDVASAFVYGYLARKEPERARLVLDAWEADRPGDAHVAFMWGIYWLWLLDSTSNIAERRACLDRAQAEFEEAIARQPRHESARMALAELSEDQHRFGQALGHYVESAKRFPALTDAQVGLARVLRQLGRLDEARAVVAPLASRSEPASGVAAEIGQIELESGNYEEAKRWFGRADLDPAADAQTLTAVASALALTGEVAESREVFARVDAASMRAARIEDLLARLATGAPDKEAAEELQRLARPPADVPETVPVPEKPRPGAPLSASELYARDCAACHGANGDGNGRAARHLFPRARDLRTGKSRLASTVNGIPTLDDLEAVIRQGMPGTSMRSFEDLSEAERKLLAQEVLRLNREGVREQFVRALESEGEQVDEEEIREVVALCTTPGEAVPIPPMGLPAPQRIASGKQAYFNLGCDHCHGNDGEGVSDSPLFDDQGRPSLPRNLIDDPFRGGEDPESIYLRIFVGMPGTPHPGCPNLAPEQLIDLVHYCRSLGQEPKRVQTNYEQAIRAASYAYVVSSDQPAGP
jgi:mono/diheme cytochrome c family protein